MSGSANDARRIIGEVEEAMNALRKHVNGLPNRKRSGLLCREMRRIIETINFLVEPLRGIEGLYTKPS